MEKIYDCRRKEVLILNRKDGDISFQIRNRSGRVKFEIWFEMKRPYKKTLNKILKAFREIKNCLERQDE